MFRKISLDWARLGKKGKFPVNGTCVPYVGPSFPTADTTTIPLAESSWTFGNVKIWKVTRQDKAVRRRSMKLSSDAPFNDLASTRSAKPSSTEQVEPFPRTKARISDKHTGQSVADSEFVVRSAGHIRLMMLVSPH